MTLTLFRRYCIKGWRRHYPIPGRPDFVFAKARLAIFVDGCFWHGCPWHHRLPTSNVAFWRRKFEDNRSRDKKTGARLRQKNWKVIRIWEHSLRKPERLLAHIRSALNVTHSSDKFISTKKVFAASRPRSVRSKFKDKPVRV